MNDLLPKIDHSYSDRLDEKIRNTFVNESLYKNPDFYSVFHSYNLPSFIKDWLIRVFTVDDTFDRDSCLRFLSEKVPHRGFNLRHKLIHLRSPLQILSRLIIHTDLLNGKICFSIPDLGIANKEGMVSLDMARDKLDMLHEGEVWGILTLVYSPPSEYESGHILLIDYKPFQPYSLYPDFFLQARKNFSIEEWIDLIVRTMEFNPHYEDVKLGKYFDLKRKMTLISRLLVFVEPNLNMIELAPKGTGKSYVYNNLSKYNWTVSGGIITRANLFYNISTRLPGVIHHYDFLVLDEIETLAFSNEDETLGAFKNYLENGKIVVANYTGRSDCGLMMLGNLRLDRRMLPRHRNYFTGLPQFFQSSAFVDRIHGFIEGWELFRFNENMKMKGIALNSEYFSEILHFLRYDADYSAVVDELLEIPHSSDTRDTKAVKKLCTAYLKLLFPHVKDAGRISTKDFDQYVLQPSLQKRAVIRYQLSELDPEYHQEMPDIRCRK